MPRLSLRVRVTLLGAALALPTVASSPLLAQPAPPAPQVAQAPPSNSDLELAQQQFMEGRDALKRGDHGRALVLFLKSQQLHPTPGTLLNVAACEEQLGMTASASQHFRAVMTQVPESDDRLPLAKEGVNRVAPRISFLRIERAAGAPASMRIKRGEELLAAASLEVEQPADPGTYIVTTSAPGHEDRRYEVQLTEGKHVSLVVDAGSELPAAAPPPLLPPPPPPSNVRRSLAFALGGVGVTGLGVSAVTGILAIVKKNEVVKACPIPAQCSPSGREIEGSGRSLAGVSTASLIFGVAAAGAGAVLFFTSGDKPAPTAAVGPAALNGGGGVVVRGAF